MKRNLTIALASLLIVPSMANATSSEVRETTVITASSTKELSSSEKATAYMYAKEAIKKKCKYPSTCEFPKLYNTDVVKFYTQDGYHGLGVTFKAENTFGQKCNTRAVVIFEWKNGKPKFVSVEVFQ